MLSNVIATIYQLFVEFLLNLEFMYKKRLLLKRTHRETSDPRIRSAGLQGPLLIVKTTLFQTPKSGLNPRNALLEVVATPTALKVTPGAPIRNWAQRTEKWMTLMFKPVIFLL